MKLHARYVTVSDFDDQYFEVSFGNAHPAADYDPDAPMRPYVLLQRQSEDEDGGVCYLETHDPDRYAGHLRLRLVEFTPTCLAFETHHERWDGAGYPRGLRGREIPVCGRIAAVADVFDALTSERPYKSAWSTQRARDFIAEGSGKQFDPECVAAFEDRWEAVLSVYRSAQLASGRLEDNMKIRMMAGK